MIRSGIAPIDDLLGGFRPGSSYLLTGGPGSGKSSCCLQFADAGLRRGERVAMLVLGRAVDVRAHAASLGIDLATGLRDGRLLLLRYRSDFARRAAHALSTNRVLDDLRHIIGPHRPKRIVIDSFAPLLDDGSASSEAAASLADFLERAGSTSLLTYPGDLRNGYDRCLEPIVQSAAGLLRLSRDEVGTHRVEALSLRQEAARTGVARFVIRPRQGIALIASAPHESIVAATPRPPLAVQETDRLTQREVS